MAGNEESDLSISWLSKNRFVRFLYFGILVRFARWGPFSSVTLGPVRHVHASVENWLKVNPARGRYELLAPSFEVEYSPPGLAVPEIPPNFAKNLRQRIPETYLVTLKNARVVYKSFEVVSPADGLFSEFCFGQSERSLSAKSWNSLWLPRICHFEGTAALIMTSGASNYYHWLNDCLPRLHVLELLGHDEAKLIVPSELTRFQRESLALLGIGEDRLVPFGSEHWSFDELLVPSLVNIPQHSSKVACHWLRRKLLSGVDDEKGIGPKRIYISRAAARKRRVLNENEIIRLLQNKGFVAIQTEKLSMVEQIELAHGADVVVAPHGAGLSNSMFMKEGAAVVELLPANRGKPCYYSLAEAVGLRYACVTDAEAKHSKSHLWGPDVDFRIPSERIAAAVDWALR